MLALYIAAGIVLFILVVLSIPVDMAFDVGGPGARRSRMRVGWLLGLLGKEIGQRRKKPKERASKREKKRLGAKPFLSLLVTQGAARALVKLSRRILSDVRVRHLDARLRIGLEDPADTGMLYSALWPVLVPLTYNSSAKVRMELSFEEPALDLAAHGLIRVFPIQMMWPVLLFALSPTGLRTMKRMVIQR